MVEYLPVLMTSPLFSGIEPQEVTAMLNCLAATTRRFDKNEFIARAGSSIQMVGMVVEGRALIVTEDYWGNRNLIGIVQPGDLFAEAYACVPGSEMRVSVIADTPCTVVTLDIHRVLTTCSSSCVFHARLVENLVGQLALKNLQMNEKLEHMGKRSTRDKLLSYLSSQAIKAGSPYFTIPMNRQQLADYLSVDRSAMSSELGKMRDEGLVEFNRSDFHLLGA